MCVVVVHSCVGTLGTLGVGGFVPAVARRRRRPSFSRVHARLGPRLAWREPELPEPVRRVQVIDTIAQVAPEDLVIARDARERGAQSDSLRGSKRRGDGDAVADTLPRESLRGCGGAHADSF